MSTSCKVLISDHSIGAEAYISVLSVWYGPLPPRWDRYWEGCLQATCLGGGVSFVLHLCEFIVLVTNTSPVHKSFVLVLEIPLKQPLIRFSPM